MECDLAKIFPGKSRNNLRKKNKSSSQDDSGKNVRKSVPEKY